VWKKQVLTPSSDESMVEQRWSFSAGFLDVLDISMHHEICKWNAVMVVEVAYFLVPSAQSGWSSRPS
jgi:hypothetical protein